MSTISSAIFAIDFDGTIVEHRYPKIGKPVPDAFKSMKELQAHGARLILYTMRSGDELNEAIQFCKEQGVEFWGVNSNPQQASWTSSPKVYAHRYIDDAAVGIPLLRSRTVGERPFVDWATVMTIIRREYGLPIPGEPDRLGPG